MFASVFFQAIILIIFLFSESTPVISHWLSISFTACCASVFYVGFFFIFPVLYETTISDMLKEEDLPTWANILIHITIIVTVVLLFTTVTLYIYCGWNLLYVSRGKPELSHWAKLFAIATGASCGFMILLFYSFYYYIKALSKREIKKILRKERKVEQEEIRAERTAHRKGYKNAAEMRKAEKVGFEEVKEWLEAENLGFKTKQEWLEAENLGFKTKQKWQEFKNSGFISKKAWEEAQSLGFNTWMEMKYVIESGYTTMKEWEEAQSLGFETKQQWEEALSLGFTTMKEWEEALSLGFETKQQWEEAENLGFVSFDEYQLAQSLKVKDKKSLVSIICSELKKLSSQISKYGQRIKKYKGLVLVEYDSSHLEHYKEELEKIESGLSSLLPVIETYNTVKDTKIKQKSYGLPEISNAFLKAQIPQLLEEIRLRKVYLAQFNKVVDLIKDFTPNIQVNLDRIAKLSDLSLEELKLYLEDISNVMPGIGKYLELENVFVRHYSADQNIYDFFDEVRLEQQKKNSIEEQKVNCLFCGAKFDYFDESTSVKCLNCGKEAVTCPICRQTIIYGEKVVLEKNCGTFFHRDHIIAWIGSNENCPICKKRINEQSLQSFEPASNSE